MYSNFDYIKIDAQYYFFQSVLDYCEPLIWPLILKVYPWSSLIDLL